jgi:hypothetical protein
MVALRLSDERSLRMPKALKEHRIKLVAWSRKDLQQIMLKNAEK